MGDGQRLPRHEGSRGTTPRGAWVRRGDANEAVEERFGLEETTETSGLDPRSLLMVETKALKDEIACENGKLLQNGKIIPKDMIRQANGEAKTVSELIRSSTGVGAWVVPILC